MPLKNIPLTISPELLKILAEMGHGDELLISDANFPSHSTSPTAKVVSCPGVDATTMLDDILKLFPLDQYVDCPVAYMEVVGKPKERAPVVDLFQKIVNANEGKEVTFESIERFKFYHRAKNVYAIVSTGEGRLYGNIILKKGVLGTLTKQQQNDEKTIPKKKQRTL